MLTILLHDELAKAATLRADVLARHGIDTLHLAHLSREHRRLSLATGNLSPSDLQQYRLIVQQIEQEEAVVRRALADLFHGEPGIVHVTGMASLSQSQQEAVRQAAAFLSSVTAMNVTAHLTVQPGRLREAYDPATCSLLLSYTGTPAPVVVHELGHALEHQAASALQIDLRQSFFAARTAAEAAVPLLTVTGNLAYHPTEHTKTDKWLHPYIGKLYADLRASELVSMGLQLLYSDPVLLMGDLEYLDFMYVFLRSAYE